MTCFLCGSSVAVAVAVAVVRHFELFVCCVADSSSKSMELTEKYRDFPMEFPKDSLPVEAEIFDEASAGTIIDVREGTSRTSLLRPWRRTQNITKMKMN